MSRTTLIRITSAIPIAAASLASAQPLTYTIQELPGLGNNTQVTGSNATGMNEAGHVAGTAKDDLGHSFAVVWIDAVPAIVAQDEPGLSFFNAKGINNNDVFVGQGLEQLESGGWQGCPMGYEDGVGLFRPVENPPGSGWAWAINDSNQVGFRSGGMFINDPVDGVREFGFPGGTPWEVWEINNAGVATGSARPIGGQYLHAYRYDYDTDTIVDLADNPELDSHSTGYGINELGDVAGFSGLTSTAFRHPIVWAIDGRVIALPVADLAPDYIDCQAEHINGHGDTVGRDSHPAGGPFKPIGWVSYDVTSVGPADVTTQGAGAGDPGYGEPDHAITGADINYYVNFWVADDLGVADVTTQGAGEGDPGYGVPDGLISAADINWYVNAWVAGPATPTPVKHSLFDVISPADALAWTHLHPFEINDAGQICGIGIVNGMTRGFLMTPSN